MEGLDKKTIDLLRACFSKNDRGGYNLRVVIEDTGRSSPNAVSSQSNIALESLIAGSVIRDEKGQLAIRLSAGIFGKTNADHEKERLINNDKNVKQSLADIKKA